MAIEILIGIGASILTAIASIPQLVKLIKEKKADDISVLMYCILLAGLGLWVYYGFLKKDLILIVSNVFSFCLNAVVLLLALNFKK